MVILVITKRQDFIGVVNIEVIVKMNTLSEVRPEKEEKKDPSVWQMNVYRLARIAVVINSM